jgi:hypothetical protein
MSRLRLGLGLCSALLFSLPQAALASPLFELIGGSFGSGGLSARTTGAAASSAYFNPALLPHARQGIELGVLLVNDAISIELLGKNPATDVPEGALSRFGSALPSVPTSWLQSGCDPALGGSCASTVPAAPRQAQGSSGNVRLYQGIGLVAHVLPRYLTLGLHALVPYGGFTSAHSFFVDEREQFYSNSLHPEMYSDRLTPVSLAFGAGTRMTPWLSLGLSFTLSLQNRANAVAYVGNSANLQESLQLSTKVGVDASVSPHFGVLLEPTDDVDVSFTLHSPQKMVIATEFGIYLPNGDLQHAARPATHAYEPWIVGAGLSWDLHHYPRGVASMQLSGTYERWSQYVNRQSERALPGYAFHDTVSATLGARLRHADVLTVFADATFHQTPVPLQRGRTNYVDNDRVGFGVGATYDVPLPSYDLAVRFGTQAQVFLLPRRLNIKRDFGGQSGLRDEWPDDTLDIRSGATIPEAAGLQSNNPGFPGFASEGLILGGNLSASLLY